VHGICAALDELIPNGRPHDRRITYVTDRPGHDHGYAIDATKLERELGWRAEETFATGLAKTVQWYLKNEDWWRPLRQRVYAGERIGLVNITKLTGKFPCQSASQRPVSMVKSLVR
jgi:dTDP-glucose 4,6-dehydratase